MRRLLQCIREILFPGWLHIAQTALGAVGLGSQLFGGGGSNAPSPSTAARNIYTPTGLPGADTNMQALLSMLSGQSGSLPGQVDPALMSSFLQSLGINYAPLQQAGQTAGAASTGYGNLASAIAPEMAGAGAQILNTSMDPQKALFNQQTQQLTDQSNAIESMYGLGSSPIGASITANTLGNFDINWQNQQLSRQGQGIQGAVQANNSATGAAAQAPGAYYAGGALPIQAAQTAAQAPGSAASAYTSGVGASLNPALSASNPLLQYLNYGAGGQANSFNAALGASGYNAGQTYGAANSLFQGLGNNPGQNMLNFFGSPSSVPSGTQGTYSGGSITPGSMYQGPTYPGQSTSY